MSWLSVESHANSLFGPAVIDEIVNPGPATPNVTLSCWLGGPLTSPHWVVTMYVAPSMPAGSVLSS